MAEIIENKKGFKVIRVSLLKIQRNFRGLGICDWCGDDLETAIYIPVMHSCYCDECYKDWIKRAVNHPEDHDFENRAFIGAKKLLNIL